MSVVEHFRGTLGGFALEQQPRRTDEMPDSCRHLRLELAQRGQRLVLPSDLRQVSQRDDVRVHAQAFAVELRAGSRLA